MARGELLREDHPTTRIMGTERRRIQLALLAVWACVRLSAADASACNASAYVNAGTTVTKTPQRSVCARVGTWALDAPLQQPRRNHDCRVLGERTVVNLLGRWARSVETVDLLTGERRLVEASGHDPDGRPLGDLNHVYSVIVPKLGAQSADELEAWLPCGFHGNMINHEVSTNYARIVDLSTLHVRLGPRLLRAGGACAALALEIDGPGTPAHVCSFGGTDGPHDGGVHLDTVACYDRVRERWHQPFGKLPTGLDHTNAALLPPGLCAPADPARILVFNYRTSPYWGYSPFMYAHDLHADGSHAPSADGRGWYVYANSYSGLDANKSYNRPRDAAGLVSAAGGRYQINIGGVSRIRVRARRGEGTRVSKRIFSDVRAFDACTRRWAPVSSVSLGIHAFALQTCASAKLGLALTCGGRANGWAPRGAVPPIPHAQTREYNLNLCIAMRFEGELARLDTR